MAETWELAERIRAHVAGCDIVVRGAPVRLTLSLGITVGEAAAAGSEKLLQTADSALYQAKNDGRNRVAPSIGRAAGAAQVPAPQRSDFWL